MPRFTVVFTTLAVLMSPAAGLAQEDEFEKRILEELRAKNPAAADTFVLGNQAREVGKHEEAEAHYAWVTVMTPEFSHAWRRQGFELLELNRRSEAIEKMRRAVALEDSSGNLVALAQALASPVGDEDPPRQDLNEARSLVQGAEAKDPAEPYVAYVACQIALQSDDTGWLALESARLEQLAPDSPMGPAFAAVHSSITGDMDGAKRHLERAKALGLSDELYRSLTKSIEHPPESRWVHFAKVGGIVFVSWLTGFLFLYLIGSALSRAALHASQQVPSQESGGATGLDAALRKMYRSVIAACCGYYYLSIPLVLATVLLVGGGLILVMLETGHIPIKLFAIVVILVLVTLWSILKSIFIRSRDEDPGLKANPGENPRLRQVLDDVAARIGTRPVTNVYFTPGTEFAVMERGGVLSQMTGQSERCLILGVGVLDGMKMRPFRSVLAHEYGHFSNQDTAGGGLALAVRRSLHTTAAHLMRGGAAAWYNPAWLFLNGYYRIFLRISQGASRLQEVLADRWAAFGYGYKAFQEGLRHVIESSIRFNVHADSVLTEVIEGRSPIANLHNLYTWEAGPGDIDPAKLQEAVEAEMEREPSPYDSHPRPADRFAWVEALGSTGATPEPDDSSEAWTLFDDREGLEQRLTDIVRRNVAAAHGLQLPSAPSGAEPPAAIEAS